MIIVKLSGGLGNQLFQYAFGLKWARYHRTTLKIDVSGFNITPPSSTPRRYFNLDLFELDYEFATPSDYLKIGLPLMTSDSFIAKGWNKLWRSWHPNYIVQNGFSDLYQSAVIPNNSYLDGYWINKYDIQQVWPKLVEQLVINQTYRKETATTTKVKRTESVCLHIRRTDYVTNGHFELPKDYYFDGIKKMKELVNQPLTVFIFSDDIDWCKKNLTTGLKLLEVDCIFIDQSIFHPEDHFMYHFYLMTCCKHFVIANSTFSWWAANLGTYKNKMVICPAQFEASNTQHIHLILKDWHPIPIH